MQQLKHYIESQGSYYAAAKRHGVTASQLHRLVAKGARVDDEGVIWMPSKTKLNGSKQND